MKNTKDKVKLLHKGVTATGSDINESCSSPKPDCNDCPTDNLQSVQEELRHVIELMGPSTPHLTLNTSSEADNEDSLITSASFYSSVLQVKHVARTDECGCHKQQFSDTPRDISQFSALPADSAYEERLGEYSIGNDVSSTQINQQPHYLTCPCRQYMKSLQELASNKAANLFKTNENFGTAQKPDDQDEKRGAKEKAANLLNLLRLKKPSKESTKEYTDLYKINILQPNNFNNNGAPRRLVFDLIEDIPKPETNTVATNTMKEKLQTNVGIHSSEVRTPFHTYLAPPKFPAKKIEVITREKAHVKENNTRVDIYYFDHGNSAYFRTTDCSPALFTEVIAEKTEAYTSKFWAQFFGTVHIGFAFFTSFILQLLRFLLQSFVRPLTVGIAQLSSDYFFKPCLAVLFNAVIQPPLIFLYNVATSLRDLADPLAEGIGYFFKEIANIFRSIRVVEVKQEKSPPPPLYRRRPLKPRRVK